MKMQASNYNLKWMRIKAEEEAEKLNKSEKALNEYMKAKNIATIENRVTIIPQKLAELSIELTRAETRQKELATLYKKIRSSLDNANEVETIPVIANDPALKSIRDQIHKVEQNIMEQSKKYGPKHPVMVRVNSELKVLQTKHAQEIQRIIKTIKNEYELAISNARDLRESLDKTYFYYFSFRHRFHYNIGTDYLGDGIGPGDLAFLYLLKRFHWLCQKIICDFTDNCIKAFYPAYNSIQRKIGCIHARSVAVVCFLKVQ